MNLDPLLINCCCPPLFVCYGAYVTDNVFVHCIGECTGEDAQNQILVNVITVADNSSLRQAKELELKGKASLSRSNTKPDAETSHAPTTQDNCGLS
jgi:hypothetical protein